VAKGTTKQNLASGAKRVCAALQATATSIHLLLPALIPSWRFFDVIAPSPRIEYALQRDADDEPQWREFRPRPRLMPLAQMLWRLFWNPVWNEQLYLVSCAERILENPTAHSIQEIFKRIWEHLSERPSPGEAGPYLRFRLVLISRVHEAIEREIVFLSDLQNRAGDRDPPPMAGPLPVLVDGWRFDQFVLV
jgi:hypothetical protein